MEEKEIYGGTSITDFFHARQKSFLTSLEHVLALSASDDIIQKMFHDQNSSFYVPSRITEIITTILHDDREILIKKQSEQLLAYEACFGKSRADEIISIGQRLINASTQQFKREGEMRDIIKLLTIQLESVQKSLNYKKETEQSGSLTQKNEIKRKMRNIQTNQNLLENNINSFLNDMKISLQSTKLQFKNTITGMISENNNLHKKLNYLNRQTKHLMKQNEDLKKMLSQSQDHLSRSQKQYDDLIQYYENPNDRNNFRSSIMNQSENIFDNDDDDNGNEVYYQTPNSSPTKSSLKNSKNSKDNEINNISFDEIKYKQLFDDASSDLANLKSQLQSSDIGQLKQSLIYASETIKSRNKQISELNDHIQDLNSEISSLGGQLQSLTAIGAKGNSPKKVKFFANDDMSKSTEKVCSFDDFENMMHERNDLADKLDQLNNINFKNEKQILLLESKIKELNNQSAKKEKEANDRYREMQNQNQELSSKMSDFYGLKGSLDQLKNEKEMNLAELTKKNTMIQSLTKENARLIGQMSVLSRFDDYNKNNNNDDNKLSKENDNEIFSSIDSILDSLHLDSNQNAVVAKLIRELQRKKDQKISDLEQDNYQKQVELQSKNQNNEILMLQMQRIKSKTDLALKQNKEKAEEIVNHAKNKLERKQKEIENLKESLNKQIQQNLKLQNPEKIIELDAKISELHQILAIKQRKIEDFQVIMKSFEQQKEQLELKINQIDSEKGNEIKNLQKTNYDLLEKLAKEQDENKSISKELEQMRSEYVSLTDKFEKTYNDLSNKENEIKSNNILKEKLEKSLNENKQLQNSNSLILKESQNNLNEKIQQYQTALHDTKKKVKALTTTNQQLEAKIRSKRDQISQQIKLIDDLQKSSDLINEEKSKAEQKLQEKNINDNAIKDEHQRSLKQIIKEKEKLTIKLKESESEIDKLKNQIQQVSNTNMSNLQNIESLKMEVQGLNQSIKQKDLDISNKETQISSLQNANLQAQQQISSLTQPNTFSPTQFQSPTQPFDNAILSPSVLQQQHQPQYSPSRNEMNQMSFRIQDLEDRLAEREREIEQQKKKIDQLNSKIRNLEKAKSKLISSMEERNINYDNDDSFESNSSELVDFGRNSPKTIRKHSSNTSPRRQKADLFDENKFIQMKLEKCEEKNEAATRQIQSLTQEQNKLKDSLRENEREQNKLKDSLKENEREQNKLKESLKDSERELTKFKEAIDNSEKEKNKLKDSLQESKRENTKLVDSLKEIGSEQEKMKKKIFNFENEKQKLQENLIISERDKKNLEELLNINNKEKDKLKANINDLTTEKGRINDELHALSNEKNKLSNSLKEITQRNDSITKEKKEIDDSLVNKSKEIESKTLENANLNSQIIKLNAQIQKLQNSQQNLFENISKSLNIDNLDQAPPKITKLIEKIEAIQENFDIKKGGDVVSCVCLQTQNLKKIRKSLGLGKDEDIIEGAKRFARDFEDFQRFKEEFSQRELHISSILSSFYSFEAVPTILENSKKLELEIISLLKCKGANSIANEVQRLKNNEDMFEKAYQCSSPEEVQKAVLSQNAILQNLASLLEVNDLNEIPQKIKDYQTDFSKIEKAMAFDDTHSNLQSFLQSYNNTKKATNSESYEEMFSKSIINHSNVKKIKQILQPEDPDNYVDKIAEMKEILKSAESQVDPEIEESNLPSKVSELSARCKTLREVSKILNLNEKSNNYTNIPKEIAFIINRESQIQSVLGLDNLENVVHVVEDLRNQIKQTSLILQISDPSESVVPCVSNLKTQNKQILDMFPNSKNENLVKSIADQTSKMKKIYDIFPDSTESSIIKDIEDQTQQMKKISSLIEDKDSIVNSIKEINKKMKKISELYPNSQDLVEDVFIQNQKMQKIGGIFNNNGDIVDNVVKQNQQLKKISEEFDKSQNFVDDVLLQNQQMKKICEVYDGSENIVSEVISQNQQIKKISEILTDFQNSKISNNNKNDSNDQIVGAVYEQNLIIRKLVDIIPNSDPNSIVEKVGNLFNDMKQITQLIRKDENKSSKIENRKQPIAIKDSKNYQNGKIKKNYNDKKIDKKNNQNRTPVRGDNKADRCDSIVGDVAYLVSMDNKKSRLIDDAKNIINADSDESLIISLKTLKSIVDLFKENDHKKNRQKNDKLLSDDSYEEIGEYDFSILEEEEENDQIVDTFEIISDMKNKIENISKIIPHASKLNSQQKSNYDIVEDTTKTVNQLNSYASVITKLTDLLNSDSYLNLPEEVELLYNTNKQVCQILGSSNQQSLVKDIIKLKETRKKIGDIIKKSLNESKKEQNEQNEEVAANDIDIKLIEHIQDLSNLRDRLKSRLQNEDIYETVIKIEEEQSEIKKLLEDEEGDTIIEKAAKIKQKKIEQIELIESIKNKLNIEDISQIVSEIDILQEDLLTKNSLLNELAFHISNNWQPFEYEDLKESVSLDDSNSLSPRRRMNRNPKSVNEYKIEQFEIKIKQINEFRSEIDSILSKENLHNYSLDYESDSEIVPKKLKNQGISKSSIKSKNNISPKQQQQPKHNKNKHSQSLSPNIIPSTTRKNQIEKKTDFSDSSDTDFNSEEQIPDLITSLNSFLKIFSEKSEHINKLLEICGESDDISLIENIKTLVENDSTIRKNMKLNKNDNMIKHIQDLLDKYEINEASVCLQSCEFESLNTKADQSEAIIKRIQQITKTEDKNNLVKKIYDLVRNEDDLHKILNSENIVQSSSEKEKILKQLNSILQVEQSKLPETVVSLINQKKKLSNFQKNIKELLKNEEEVVLDNEESQLDKNDKILTYKIQRLIDQRNNLDNQVKQIKSIMDDKEDFIEKVQNLKSQVDQLKQILNNNDEIPETVKKLAKTNEAVMKLIKTENEESLLNEISSILEENEKNKADIEEIRKEIQEDEDYIKKIKLLNKELGEIHKVLGKEDDLPNAVSRQIKTIDSLKRIFKNQNDPKNDIKFDEDEDFIEEEEEEDENTSDSKLIENVSKIVNENFQLKKDIEEIKSIINYNDILNKMAAKQKKLNRKILQSQNNNKISPKSNSALISKVTPNSTKASKTSQMKSIPTNKYLNTPQKVSNSSTRAQIKTPKSSNSNSPKSSDKMKMNNEDKPKEENPIITIQEVIRNMKNKEDEMKEILDENDDFISETKKLKNLIENMKNLLISNEKEHINNSHNQQNDDNDENDSEYDKEEFNISYEELPDRLDSILKELSDSQEKLAEVQKITRNENNFIEVISKLVDQQNQLKNILNTENEDEIPQIVSNYITANDSIHNILANDDRDKYERQQILDRIQSLSNAVNASTQTQPNVRYDTNEYEIDLPSRVQAVVSVNSELQEQFKQVCSILPQNEEVNLLNKIKQMKDNEQKLKDKFKSENFVEVAIKQTNIIDSLKDIIHVNDNDEIIHQITQIINENEKKKKEIDDIKKELNNENNYLNRIKQLKNEEREIREILNADENLPNLVSIYANTVKTISKVINSCEAIDSSFDVKDDDEEIEEEEENCFEFDEEKQKELIDTIQKKVDENNQMRRECEMIDSIIQSDLSDDNTARKDIISDLKKKDNKMKALYNSNCDYILETKRMKKSIDQIANSIKKYNDSKGAEYFSEEEETNEKSTMINYEIIPTKIDAIISDLILLESNLNEVKKITNEQEKYIETIGDIINSRKKLEEILQIQGDKNESLKNIPTIVQNLVDFRNEVESIVKTNRSLPNSENKKELFERIKLLEERNVIFEKVKGITNENDDDEIEEKVSLLMNHSKTLSTISNLVNAKKHQQALEAITNQVDLLNNLKKLLNSENVYKSTERIIKENKQLKEAIQKIQSSISSTGNAATEVEIVEDVQNLVEELSQLKNERLIITKIIDVDDFGNNEKQQLIEEIRNLKNLKDKLQQLLSRKEIIPEVQRLLTVSGNAAKVAKALDCSIDDITQKVTELKEIMKKSKEDSDYLNDLLKCNSTQKSISKTKKLISLLNEPQDINDEVSHLMESLKKVKDDFERKQNQDKAALYEMQTVLDQMMRLTETKSAKNTIERIDQLVSLESQLLKIMKMSDSSNIPLKIEQLLNERAKILLYFDSSPSENIEDLPQQIFDLKKRLSNDEKILKQLLEITKTEDQSQLPRVVAEICQQSQLIKSIHKMMENSNESKDQLPETIAKLTQDSAALTIRNKEYETLMRDYDDLRNFVKRILSVLMEGHSPQKMKFPIPSKAKDKLLEFLRSLKKKSESNSADIKLVLKRAAQHGYFENDLIEAVNSIVDGAVAVERQQNLEDMHEKAKSLRQINDKTKAQYDTMKDKNKKRVQEMTKKIEEIQRKAIDKETEDLNEIQKQKMILMESTAELEKEKRIHEELIRLLSKQVVDVDYLRLNVSSVEMRTILQYTK